MSLGKSVFLSRMGSLPEIGGELAHYFPNFEPEEMAEIVSQGLKNYRLNSGIKEELIARSKQFSWDNAARGYADIYRSLGKM
jgi:glycosyltransferase involved in cell wall biosynthesis